ncbi:MAG: LptF/LptG family permease [Longimicrobiales bacterium]|nr:LptF/LptG family permease [Longimicrobiales bacterium]
MIRILDRLVATTFLKLFLIFLAASPPLFILGDITENLDTYLDRGLTRAEVATAYFFQLPLFVQWSFPIAALVAAVFTIHSMTTHREIVAAKAGGISFHRVALPILLVGLLLTGVALVLTEVVPRSNRIAAQILRDEDPRRSWRSDFAYQSDNGMTWQVGRVDAPEGRMDHVIVEQAPADGQNGLHVIAEAANFDSLQGWTFARGYVRHFLPDSTQRAYQFERLRVAGITEKPHELLEAPRKPDEMTYQEVDRLARIIERSGGDPAELLVKREQKFSIPVATLVVILFGVPLATSSGRGGTAYGIGVSLGTTILYLLLFKVSGALGQAGTMPPLAAAWLPNVLFFGTALVLLRRVRT